MHQTRQAAPADPRVRDRLSARRPDVLKPGNRAVTTIVAREGTGVEAEARKAALDGAAALEEINELVQLLPDDHPARRRFEHLLGAGSAVLEAKGSSRGLGEGASDYAARQAISRISSKAIAEFRERALEREFFGDDVLSSGGAAKVGLGDVRTAGATKILSSLLKSIGKLQNAKSRSGAINASEAGELVEVVGGMNPKSLVEDGIKGGMSNVYEIGKFAVTQDVAGLAKHAEKISKKAGPVQGYALIGEAIARRNDGAAQQQLIEGMADGSFGALPKIGSDLADAIEDIRRAPSLLDPRDWF